MTTELIVVMAIVCLKKLKLFTILSFTKNVFLPQI